MYDAFSLEIMKSWQQRCLVEKTVSHKGTASWVPDVPVVLVVQATILVSLRGTPTWRLHTKLCKIAWHVRQITWNDEPHRLETWKYCLCVNLLEHFIFLLSFIEWFDLIYYITWQWKHSIILNNLFYYLFFVNIAH